MLPNSRKAQKVNLRKIKKILPLKIQEGKGDENLVPNLYQTRITSVVNTQIAHAHKDKHSANQHFFVPTKDKSQVICCTELFFNTQDAELPTRAQVAASFLALKPSLCTN